MWGSKSPSFRGATFGASSAPPPSSGRYVLSPLSQSPMWGQCQIPEECVFQNAKRYLRIKRGSTRGTFVAPTCYSLFVLRVSENTPPPDFKTIVVAEGEGKTKNRGTLVHKWHFWSWCLTRCSRHVIHKAVFAENAILDSIVFSLQHSFAPRRGDVHESSTLNENSLLLHIENCLGRGVIGSTLVVASFWVNGCVLLCYLVLMALCFFYWVLGTVAQVLNC